MYENGERPIALSQELVAWSQYASNKALPAGTKIELKSTDYPSDARCNGTFTLADTMNARFTNRGDIFFPTRDLNISCHADVYVLPN